MATTAGVGASAAAEKLAARGKGAHSTMTTIAEQAYHCEGDCWGRTLLLLHVCECMHACTLCLGAGKNGDASVAAAETRAKRQPPERAKKKEAGPTVAVDWRKGASVPKKRQSSSLASFCFSLP